MKISQFSKINGVTVDSVRHYMDLGLILPDKKGGQYYFDEQCLKDLKEILNLKSMGFSLNEIKAIFMFKNFGKLTSYEEDEYYRAFFTNKQQSIEEKIKELRNIEKKLEGKIKELAYKSSNAKRQIGISFKALEMIKCLKCKGNMMVSGGSISNNEIINGVLTCNCGEKYVIKDGILIIDSGEKEYNLQKKFNPHHIREYINATDTSYLENLYKGMEWINKKINFESFNGKTLLELGSGLGFFLRYLYEKLPENCVYIAVDHDLERHIFLKNVLQQTMCKRNIIFICSDFLEIPIGDESIDIIVDCSGTSNYSFHNEEFLLDNTDRYVKRNGTLIGTYILFEKFSHESLIENRFRKNFNLKVVKNKIQELEYNIVDERISDSIGKGGKYEDFFVTGEKVFTYSFLGKR